MIGVDQVWQTGSFRCSFDIDPRQPLHRIDRRGSGQSASQFCAFHEVSNRRYATMNNVRRGVREIFPLLGG